MADIAPETASMVWLRQQGIECSLNGFDAYSLQTADSLAASELVHECLVNARQTNEATLGELG